jgi:hypothetical protein
MKILLVYQDGIEKVNSARVFFMEPFGREVEAPKKREMREYSEMLPDIKSAAMIQYGRDLKTSKVCWSRKFKCLLLKEHRGFDIFIELPGFRAWHDRCLDSMDT